MITIISIAVGFCVGWIVSERLHPSNIVSKLIYAFGPALLGLFIAGLYVGVMGPSAKDFGLAEPLFFVSITYAIVSAIRIKVKK